VPPIVVIENLHYSYPPWPPESEPVPVLRGVSLEVETGEFLALMGATASGKTTLCLALNGLVPQATGGRIKGEVRVDGLNPRHTPVAEMARRVGLVFQDPETQLFNLRVEDEIAFGLENLGLPPAEIRERVDWALDAVGLSDCRKRSPFQLSGGQQQRVAIAAVLGMTPRVLVLDEPTAGLDPAGKAEVLAVVQQLRRSQDMTIIMVEQDGELVAEFADRAAVLHEGRIALVETPEKVFHETGLLRAAGLASPQVTALADCLNARLGTHYAFSRLEEAYRTLSRDRPGTEAGGMSSAAGTRSQLEAGTAPPLPNPIDRVSGSQPVVSTIAKPVLLPVTRHPRSPHVLSRGSPVTSLETRDLWFSYPGGPPVLRGVSLALAEGEFAAIVGQNGSGKTTLVKHFNGLLRPGRGEIRLFGDDIRDRPVSRLARTVGYVFQNPDHQIFSPTTREEISFGLRQMNLATAEIQARTDEALGLFELQEFADRPPATLSSGLRRKITVASIYAMHPPVWILDEPTTGLDWGSAQALMDLVQELHRREHATVVLITHDMRLVAEYAPRCLVMQGGEVLAYGETRELFGRREVLRVAGIELPQITELGHRLGLPGPVLSVPEFCANAERRMQNAE